MSRNSYMGADMDEQKYDRRIALLCPTCGCDLFETEKGVDETIELIKCPSCKREFTKDELIEENSENISAHSDEVEKEILKDITSDFKKLFK